MDLHSERKLVEEWRKWVKRDFGTCISFSFFPFFISLPFSHSFLFLPFIPTFSFFSPFYLRLAMEASETIFKAKKVNKAQERASVTEKMLWRKKVWWKLLWKIRETDQNTWVPQNSWRKRGLEVIVRWRKMNEIDKKRNGGEDLWWMELISLRHSVYDR